MCTACRKYEAQALGGTILPPGQRLPPTALRGDWQAIAEQTAFKVNTGDHKAACKML